MLNESGRKKLNNIEKKQSTKKEKSIDHNTEKFDNELTEKFELSFTSFEDAKEQIKKYSKKANNSHNFDIVPEKGWFGFDHKVTGAEMNELTKSFQEELKLFSTLNKDLFKGFGEVYNALESLDKEYVPAILAVSRSTERIAEKTNSTVEAVRRDQKKIDKIIKENQQIIEVLQKHKSKLDNIKHLSGIDDLWERVEELQSEIEQLHNTEILLDDKIFEIEKERILLNENLKNVESNVAGNTDIINNISSDITLLNAFKNEIKEQKIDEQLDGLRVTMKEKYDSIVEHEKNIHENHKLIDSLEKLYEEKEIVNDKTVDNLNKKIKMAYYISGLAVSMGIIEFIAFILIIIR